jgi:hypothetical protein
MVRLAQQTEQVRPEYRVSTPVEVPVVVVVVVVVVAAALA